MAYLQNSSNTVISDARSGNFANVTIQNAGSLVVDYAHTFQGTIAGYAVGGLDRLSPNYSGKIQKFPFASDTNATHVGNITRTQSYGGGQSSDTSGYFSGGYISIPGFSTTTDIYKFAFVNETFGTVVSNLSQGRWASAGQSSSTHGYTSGGNYANTIDKFPFAADNNATDVGDLTVSRRGGSGQSSTTHGYTSGGGVPAPSSNVIDKFSFSTDGNATDVGDLTQARVVYGGNQSSTTHGYASGGELVPGSPTNLNTIDKFPFAADTNATDVGDLTQARLATAGQSSTTSGYNSGGGINSFSAPLVNTIDKFPFAADTNATDVGDCIPDPVGFAGGQQD